MDAGRDPTKGTGIKTEKQYRHPFEYAAVLEATGAAFERADVVANYYRERALPHLVRFPVREQPNATDSIPEGLAVWDIASPVADIDWLATVLSSPEIIPGITTRERLTGDCPGTQRDTMPIDLYLGVDCSGSMGDPGHTLSYPVLAGAIIAHSALRTGSKVKVVLSGEPGQTVSTNGFVRNQNVMLRVLTGYLGTGYSFGIHRLRETFDQWPATARKVHILIVSDNDIFMMLQEMGDGRQGWDVAREALAKAGGGGTFVLELPEAFRRQSESNIARLRRDGWNVNIVSSMEELVEFARDFSRRNYTRQVSRTTSRSKPNS
jgi:hypothetical protein